MISSGWHRFLVVFVCLTLNLVCSIKIDNQLKVITNDCYERLAIGHRLNSRDIYKTVKANTVPKCQKECTAEGDVCKAFSFGIGEKGNSTCELGKNFIKETATLQPIGTIENVDFDLYIKKLGCKLVIDPQAAKPKPNFNDVPLSQSASTQEQYGTAQNGPKPTYLPEKPTSTIDEAKPPRPQAYPNEALNKPSDIPQKPTVHYGTSIPNIEIVKPSYGNQKPENHQSEYTQYIQGSLVSVSPGLQSYLHPVHDILIGENPYTYGKPRPSRPQGYSPGIPDVNHDGDKYHERPSGGYGDEKFTSNVYKRPSDYDRYKPHSPNRPWGSEYIDNPKFLSPFDPYYDERPNPYDNTPQRPLDSYGNGKPYPNRPYPSSNPYNERPLRPPMKPSNPYDDERPSYSYDKPQKPLNSYDFQSAPETSKPSAEKPYKPVHEKPDDIPYRPYEHHLPPFRPTHLNRPYDDERPIASNRPRPGGYDLRPLALDDRIDAPYARPHPDPDFHEYFPGSKPPRFEYEVPRPMGSFHEDRRPPWEMFDDRDGPRPIGNSYKRPAEHQHDYRRPEDNHREPPRPQDDHRRPPRPEDDFRRPTRPEYDLGRPPRPEDDFRRPSRPEYDLGRPPRPEDDFRRPTRVENDIRRPPRPEDDFRRPENDYGPSFKPESDHRRPYMPDDDRRRPPVGFDDERVHLNPIDTNNKGYPRPDFHDRRPYDQRRPQRQPEDPVAYPNPDYLFSANDRNDVVSNSTKYVDSKVDSTQKKNVTAEGNGTSAGNGAYGGETAKNVSMSNSIITESTGVGGEKITSIIIPLDNACFRRVLAGKRIARRFVRRSLFCERLEDCQLECADEKRFTCEGFNYRLDPTGRGKGECELLDVPLQRLDIGRDVYPDRDYDYYEKDRNSATTNCRYEPPYPDRGGGRPPGHRPPPYDGYLPYDRRPPYDARPPDYHRRPPYEARPSGYDRDRRPVVDYDRRRPPVYDRRPPPQYGPEYDRRGDISHLHPHNTHNGYNIHSHIDRNDHIYHGTHYLPPNPSPKPIFSSPYDHKPYHNKPYGYGVIHDDRRYDRPKYDGYNINRYDDEKKNFYLPPRIGGTTDWGKYGGSYGNFGYGYGSGHNQYDRDSGNRRKYDSKPDIGYKPIVPLLPPPAPSKPSSYLPNTALEINLIHQGPNIYNVGDNLILPVEPRLPGYNYIKEECSLRSATGFKLNKGIVKKFYAVPNIYECEQLCFKEREFRCSSYAFRYTISLSAPADNCYLSNKNYKELDYYTDLQPDRDFDIYTMSNPNKCVTTAVSSRDDSDCFWRVRSGQRLDHRVVKDTLTVNSIVDCQIECLKTRRFTCRAFSFRYGPPSSGGAVDNCQLTDWPFYELDPRIDFLPERGFEVYERGSYGYGCEPYHFGVRGKPPVAVAIEVDQLCYIGFGSPARLLPQATKKALKVRTELDCKAECSKLREGTLFQCMSFSYRSSSHGSSNCFLSDIYQRDLLPHIDYVRDPDSWLFAWDNYNPQCIDLANKPVHDIHYNDLGREDYGRPSFLGVHTALDTWRAYSVSGWPCKRGHLCQENREAGFWFCKLEGGDANSWDYCCRPDHQCGYSSGFPYPWCYVGPGKTQWRKCSDRYYPYIHNLIDRFDNTHHTKPSYLPEKPVSSWVPLAIVGTPYLPEHDERPPPVRPPPVRPPIIRPGFRPERPPAPPHERPPEFSLDEYEMQFDQEFLAPPKPGGFGQPRHWPVSYLHKQMPPNITDSEPRMMKPKSGNEPNSKLTAIQSLIDIINSNELKNVQYQITNESNSKDDVLFVKIPLPTNFTDKDKTEDGLATFEKADLKLEPVDLTEPVKNNTKRFGKQFDTNTSASSEKPSFKTLVPTYRKGYITRTNVTTHGRSRFSRSL
ncbi:uncharacterized protein LOC123306292 [Coccinella septempunctata]|uniref:uncharacterized protein LOC123306292 n=1 Tax=Coccinella septempunctata TaxID=41139 RepID=UPI001D06FD83|nr:uncharacterized protein LOC123306292 [Coccinella septempunctata]